jgi:thiamine-monophosphate kinase
METQTLAQIGEDALVRRLTEGLRLSGDVCTGPGDDCAVVRPLGSGFLELLKSDCLVEGVHFLRDTAPGRVGWKAMARVVSDIASMAGRPLHALVTLVLPPSLTVSYVEDLYAGLRRCADHFGISIVGGETSRGSQIIISISLTGSVKETQCIHRNGAHPDDSIYVTGRLGGSLGGHHLDFMPRLAEAQWLTENLPVHAMMDLSDGLAKDLPRMAAASALDFVIDVSTLPLSQGCTPAQAWSDGEDYELLLALPAPLTPQQKGLWHQAFPAVPLTRIGHFVPVGQGTLPKLDGSGWDHFH